MTKFNCECVNQGFMQNKPWDKCDKCNGTGIKGSPKPVNYKISDAKTGSVFASGTVLTKEEMKGVDHLIYPFSEPLPDSIYNKYLKQQNERKSCAVVPDCMEFVPMEKFPEITANRMHLVHNITTGTGQIFQRYLHRRNNNVIQEMIFHNVNQVSPLTSLRGCVGDVVFTFTPDEKLLNMAKTVTMGRHKIYRLEDNYHLCKADL